MNQAGGGNWTHAISSDLEVFREDAMMVHIKNVQNIARGFVWKSRFRSWHKILENIKMANGRPMAFVSVHHKNFHLCRVPRLQIEPFFGKTTRRRLSVDLPRVVSAAWLWPHVFNTTRARGSLVPWS